MTNPTNERAEEKDREIERLKAENEQLRKTEASVLSLSHPNFKEYQDKIDRLSASLAAAREALDKIHKMPESSGCGDEQRIAQEALSDPTGQAAHERWKRMWEVITYANTVRNDILIPETDDQVEMSCQCKAWVDGLLERLQALEALEAKGGVSE